MSRAARSGRRTGRAAVVAVVVVLAALALAGCSGGGSRSRPELSQRQVESGVTDRLREQVGTEPASVSCPDDLVGEVGTELLCTLTRDDGTELGVTVTVTAVRDGHVDYRIAVADQPLG